MQSHHFLPGQGFLTQGKVLEMTKKVDESPTPKFLHTFYLKCGHIDILKSISSIALAGKVDSWPCPVCNQFCYIVFYISFITPVDGTWGSRNV